MVYLVLAYSLLAFFLLCLIGHYSKSDAAAENLSGPLLTSLAVAAVSGMLCITNWIDSSTSPLADFEKAIKSEIPRLNGTLTCESTELRFIGTQNVMFTYSDQRYQVDFPVNKKLSALGTYCPLNIKPEGDKVVNMLRQEALASAELIEQTLKDKEIPVYSKGEERKFLSLLLNKLDPSASVEVPRISIDTSKAKAEITTPAPQAKVKVPAVKQNADASPTRLTTDELLNNNISAQ